MTGRTGRHESVVGQKGPAMRRFSVPLTVMFVVVLGLLAPLRLSFVAAQEGTPSPEDEMPPGITAEFIAGGAVSELPPTPASFFVLRLSPRISCRTR